MQATEKHAIETGCTFLTVNTMDWEALDFYKKLGYYVEVERHGFEKNSIFYFLRKDLPTSSPLSQEASKSGHSVVLKVNEHQKR